MPRVLASTVPRSIGLIVSGPKLDESILDPDTEDSFEIDIGESSIPDEGE